MHNPGLNLIPTHRDDAELVLGAVIVDGQPSILDESLQRRPLIGEIADGVAEGRLGKDGPREILAHALDLRQQWHGLPKGRQRRRLGERQWGDRGDCRGARKRHVTITSQFDVERLAASR